MSRKSIIWLASYPKSGNTWLRIFLSRILFNTATINNLSIPIYSSKSYLEHEAVIDISELTVEELHRLRLQVYAEKAEESKFFPVKIHDCYVTTIYSQPFLPSEQTKLVLYIIRNPFDLAISFSKHLGKSIDETIQVMNNEDYCLASNVKRFQIQLPQKLSTWSNHVKSWLEQSDVPVYIVKYEDMFYFPEQTFSNILQACNIPFTEDELTDAIGFSSFDNLQKQEKMYGFEEKSVYSSSFFNTGKAYYYKNQLTSEQINTIYLQHKEIIKKFQYEPMEQL